jgi:hypothetical protein
MADSASGAAAPKPSSSVKLVLLGEAAVGKVRPIHHRRLPQCYNTGALGQHVMNVVLQAWIFSPHATPQLSPWRSQINII